MRVLAFLLIAALAQANASPFFGDMLKKGVGAMTETMNVAGSLTSNPGMLLNPGELMTEMNKIPEALTAKTPAGEDKDLMGNIKEALDKTVQSAKDNIKKIEELPKNVINQTTHAIEDGKKTMEEMMVKPEKIFKEVNETFSNVVEAAKENFEKVKNETMTNVNTMVTDIKKQGEELQKMVGNVTNGVTSQIGDIRTSLQKAVTGNVIQILVEPVTKFIEEVVTFVKTTIGDIQTKLSDILGGATKAVGDATSGVTGTTAAAVETK